MSMSITGDLLEALYRAPRCTTFHGRVRRWLDWQTLHEGRSGSFSGVISAVSGDLSGGIEEHVEVWRDERGRVRTDQGDRISVTDGDDVLAYQAGFGLSRISGAHMEQLQFPNWLWAPRSLIHSLELDEPEQVQLDGRSAWRVHAVARPLSTFGLPIDLNLGGEQFELDVDRTTGIVLAGRGRLFDGTLVSEWSWEVIEIDGPVDPAIIDEAFPPGATVVSPEQRLIERAAARGFDVSGVDPDAGTDAVLDALRDLARGAEHSPTGPPPDDENAARAEITAAYAQVAEADGDDLVHVQAGAGLAPFLAQAERRHPGATLVPRTIRFQNASDAIVFFDVMVDGRRQFGRMESRAVLVEGRWKVERAAFVRLMGLAGVDCPPAPA